MHEVESVVAQLLIEQKSLVCACVLERELKHMYACLFNTFTATGFLRYISYFSFYSHSQIITFGFGFGAIILLRYLYGRVLRIFLF